MHALRQKGRIPTVLCHAISDLEVISEVCGYSPTDWLTITPFSSRVGTRLQTLINRLSAWYEHHQRHSKAPWNNPLSCPIYRYGSLPKSPRLGRKPGCWLLDANREKEIWRQLRDFSCLGPAEHLRVRSLKEKVGSPNTMRLIPEHEQAQTAQEDQLKAPLLILNNPRERANPGTRPES